ncbi:unnamed protein product [Cyprideis torosa]|uniref:Uncharacterized protein n=1 Tax=Cyprideis torosa TaxID=163714 RepID=A0A7R8WG50_9CRUS|nr:unnamed protein product [Cyprideis torosa]CAG0897793.1 unnamed protein product [Cyprideis torosa]
MFNLSVQIETGLHRFRTAEYNPFIITDEPVGGYGELTDRERDRVKVFAGVFFTSSGAPRPTKAGRLCLWQHTTGDRRQDDDFKDFKVFRNSLRLRCDPEGEAGFLQVAPNSSWPDVVYYNSFTHRNTGNKIFIVDAFPETAFFANTAWSSKGMMPMLLLLLTFALFNAAQLH